MLKIYIILPLVFLASLQLSAQTTDQSNSYSDPKIIVKFAGLSLIDPDQTIQFGAEYFLSKNWSIQSELGYGNFSIYSQPISGEVYPKKVIRSRSEVRWYFSEMDYFIRPYLAAEFLYKHVEEYKESTFDRGSYFQIATYKNVRNVYGGHLKIGGQMVLSNNRRLILDFYTGFGFREIQVKYVDAPEEKHLDTKNYFYSYDEQGKYNKFSISLGIKIGYVLSLKK